jgi:hypothetical protein
MASAAVVQGLGIQAKNQEEDRLGGQIEMTRSASTDMRTPSFGVAMTAFFFARSESETPRAFAQRPQTKTLTWFCTRNAKSSL